MSLPTRRTPRGICDATGAEQMLGAQECGTPLEWKVAQDEWSPTLGAWLVADCNRCGTSWIVCRECGQSKRGFDLYALSGYCSAQCRGASTRRVAL